LTKIFPESLAIWFAARSSVSANVINTTVPTKFPKYCGDSQIDEAWRIP
jgi:hypothetical protein